MNPIRLPLNAIWFVSNPVKAGTRRLAARIHQGRSLWMVRPPYRATRALLPLGLAMSLVILPAPFAQAAEIRLPDGSVYHGDVERGRLQGEGRLDWANGNWLRASFRDGLAEGLGEQFFVDGTRYRGRFHHGLYEGQGQLTSPSGRYEGSFHRGMYHGKGVLESSDGWRYEGDFFEGRMQGRGARTESDGSQYNGIFTDGRLNGRGQWVDQEGNLYEGNFVDSAFSGQGRYQSVDGNVWEGSFQKGEMTGQGKYHGSDGSRYSGSFKSWQYHGLGQYTEADGSVYIGDFLNGQFDGNGTYTHADGRRESGLWSEGQFIRSDDGVYQPDPMEVALLEQGERLGQELNNVRPSTASTELYGITLAGDGDQRVFQREADYVAKLMVNRFNARSVVRLINQRDLKSVTPLATRENLHRAIATLAERSGPEDLIFVYLTSHGSSDHRLSLSEPGLQLASLPAIEFASLLEPLKNRDKIVVVSACYSGGFLPPLQDDHTMVITASRADRTSFGCTDEADFTYFGKALFAEAFQATDDPEQAFSIASKRVAEREAAQGFEPSEPQIWAPPAVLKKWQAYRAGSTSHVAEQ
ncbi:Uncharacterized conserved protein [Pseudomonas lutea]|uniref:Uncharacterized conserved protein n=1 Tax=Pseudomonas lutea TaxID=243924 RepID=A0A9X8MAQ5_9PSED|nr:Uncharacterized conserved protein [Pseudomonas lutea]